MMIQALPSIDRIQVVGICGNMRRPSKTRALVESVAQDLRCRSSLESSIFDLMDFGPELGAASVVNDLAPKGKEILNKIASADALIVGSPVYKGAYAGLFKHLFDLMAPDCLKDKPVLLTATGGGQRHALMIEHHLRPLFGFFEALSIPTVVYASEAEFSDGAVASPSVLNRIGVATNQLSSILNRSVAAA